MQSLTFFFALACKTWIPCLLVPSEIMEITKAWKRWSNWWFECLGEVNCNGGIRAVIYWEITYIFAIVGSKKKRWREKGRKNLRRWKWMRGHLFLVRGFLDWWNLQWVVIDWSVGNHGRSLGLLVVLVVFCACDLVGRLAWFRLLILAAPWLFCGFERWWAKVSGECDVWDDYLLVVWSVGFVLIERCFFLTFLQNPEHLLSFPLFLNLENLAASVYANPFGHVLIFFQFFALLGSSGSKQNENGRRRSPHHQMVKPKGPPPSIILQGFPRPPPPHSPIPRPFLTIHNRHEPLPSSSFP